MRADLSIDANSAVVRPLAPSAVALLAVAVFAVVAAPGRAAPDCAQCRAVCSVQRVYPEERSPELLPAVKHRSAEAESVFLRARAKDPAFGGNDVNAAVQSYKKAVLLDGANAQYRNYLSGALMLAGKYDEAIFNLEQAMRLVPAESKYVVNLGYAHHRRGDETRALVYYSRALILDPSDLRARLYLGFALEMLGYPEEAILELKKVAAIDPQNEGARGALARLGVPPGPIGAPPPLTP